MLARLIEKNTLFSQPPRAAAKMPAKISEWRHRAKYTVARVENRHVAEVNSYDSFGLGVEFGT